MQQIKIGGKDAILNPPADQPALPGEQSNPSGNGSQSGSNSPKMTVPGSVSETETFKAVEGSKFTTLMPASGSTTPLGDSGSSVPLGGMIDGGLATELMDALFPALLVALMAYLGAVTKKADFQLTAKEKITVAPLMQKCMDQLMINFQSPFAALGVTLLVMYGAKVGEHGLVKLIDKKAEKAAADRLRKEQQGPPPKTDAPVSNNAQQQQPATVVQMKKPEVRKPISENWQPSPEQIFEAKRRIKSSHNDVIVRLKREHAAGTLEEFFKKKPLKPSK